MYTGPSGLIYISQNIAQTKGFHGAFPFTDDLCALNDRGVFQISSKEIYSGLNYSGSQATFFDLDIPISTCKIIAKFCDKHDDFSFYITHVKLTWQHSIIYFLWKCDVRDPSHCKIIFFCCFYKITVHLLDERRNKWK